MKTEAIPRPTLESGLISAYFELTKPRITLLVVMTTAAGFYLGSQASLNWTLLIHALAGTGLIAAGTAVLNQYLERVNDGKMRRTAGRPLPSQRLSPASALTFGGVLVAAGAIYLWFLSNPLTSTIGLLTALIYLLLYTPLKTRTPWCTTIGAFPGAFPPLMGWTAATGTLDVNAWFLFGILFLWQFPHFLAIAWVYREDYQRGGFKMLPLVDPKGIKTALQVVLFSLALLLFSGLAFPAGIAGGIYLAGATVLGLLFLSVGLKLARERSRQSAQLLLRASVIYLPLLLVLLMIDRT